MGLGLDNLVPLRPLDLLELLLKLLLFDLEPLEFVLQSGDLRFHPAAKLTSFLDHDLPLPDRPLSALSPFFLEAAILLADGFAAVLALDAANVAKLVAAVAAQVIIAHAVVNVHERNVGANVTRISTPEAGKGIGRVGGAGQGPGKGLLGRQGIKVRARGRPRLVGPVGAVA